MNPKRRLLSSLGHPLSIPLILACLALAACAPKAGAGRPHEISVAYVEGDARIDGKPAEIGQAVPPNAVVETGPASRCDIVFDRKNALGIGQNSLIRIDFSGLQASLKVERGGFGAVLKNLAKVAGKDSFTIDTVNAIAGVRGTSLCVWAKDGYTYVCACNGEVHIADPKGGNALDLAAAHHSARRYGTKDGATTVEEAGLEFHDDNSVQALADRIGYRIDWTRLDR